MASNASLRSSQRFEKGGALNASHGSSSSSSTSSSGAHSKSAAANTRSKAGTTRRSTNSTSRAHSSNDHNDQESGRVRVAVRLRPRNAEELSDPDFAVCVEPQPELKRLILRKNNWNSESYRFDEVLTETASQKRVYDVVAKPVVESVLNGYNGTVMAYGQTGTGKTYTVGNLGKDDASKRGIMARALEDIIANTSPDCDSVEISYLQLYLEYIQDLLAPERNNIPINEDPKTGEVSLSGIEVVKIQNIDHFLQLLQIGEANRHAANTKLNTESSRSHAILTIYIRRQVPEKGEDEITSKIKKNKTDVNGGNFVPIIRKSKLLIVDLAGSERIDKSGSNGHLLEEAKFINLSLTSLGKCINALAENSSHIPIRDSKLTRLLRDSFGGSARTSLIVTIGPSTRYHAETASTIMFGQRAMKIVNMVKLKEEFDYESLCRKLEHQVDQLTAEVERQEKLRKNDKQELEKQLRKCQESYAEAEKQHVLRSEYFEKENAQLEMEMRRILNELNCQKEHNDSLRDTVSQLELSLKESEQQLENSSYEKILAEYEKKISDLIMQLEDEHHRSETLEGQLTETKELLNTSQKSNQQLEMEVASSKKELADTTQMYEKEIAELKWQLEDEHARFRATEHQLQSSKTLLKEHNSSMQGQRELEEKLQQISQLHECSLNEFESLKSNYLDVLQEKAMLSEELHKVRQQLVDEQNERKRVEAETVKLKKNLSGSYNVEDRRPYIKDNIGRGSLVGTLGELYKPNPSRDPLSGQRATIAKLCEEVGLSKILDLLKSEDSEVQIQAIKVVANLAAEDIYQERIVQEGGLDALLELLLSSQHTSILRIASGALANLAMNEFNQSLIIAKGGAQLLASMASKTDDPQTLRMVAGAIANLCGNEKMHPMLKEDGCISALLEVVKCGNSDVIAQVARGMANFAKCESRETLQGHRNGRSLLIEEGALTWLTANTNTASASTRRHIELALCHLAQNEENAEDVISSGALDELIRISVESSREDIRNLAKRSLKLSPTLKAMYTE